MDTLSPPAVAELAEHVQRVHQAQIAWEQLQVRERLVFVRTLRHLLVTRRSLLCQAVRDDLGKPFAEAVGGELLPLADACRFVEQQASHVLAPRRNSLWCRPLWLWGQRDEVHRRPRGVVGVIGTWNFPLYLNGVQLVQALVAGNGVIWKPSEVVPRSATVLEELFRDAGLPADLLHVMPATREGGPQLVEANIDHLVFTGANATGRRIAARLGERLISSTLELSGCDAMFVLDDADVELAARAAWFGATTNNGQTCIAVRRALVPRSRYREFLAHLKPLAEQASPVRLALPAQTEQARRLVEEAVVAGARVLNPPAPLADHPDECRPTAVVDVNTAMSLCREASFAPLLAVVPCADLDEALTIDAECPYGLGASVFTSRPGRVARLAPRLRTGLVMVNEVIVPSVEPSSPFGGARRSGWGVTQGVEGLLEMTVPQTVSVKSGSFRPHYDTIAAGLDRALEGLLLLAHGGSLRERWAGLRQALSAGRQLLWKGD